MLCIIFQAEVYAAQPIVSPTTPYPTTRLHILIANTTARTPQSHSYPTTTTPPTAKTRAVRNVG